MNSTKLARLFLRWGLAFVFVYAAVAVYIRPDSFLKYIPGVMLKWIPLDVLLALLGVVEIGLAIWLISGWKGRYAGVASFLLMAGIVVPNLEHISCLFRNIAIATGALALTALETSEKESRI